MKDCVAPGRRHADTSNATIRTRNPSGHHRDSEEIIRSEFRLAKTELGEKASDAAQSGKTLTVGLLLGFYGFGFLLLAAVYALAVTMSTWLAALIVGAVLALFAVDLHQFGCD